MKKLVVFFLIGSLLLSCKKENVERHVFVVAAQKTTYIPLFGTTPVPCLLVQESPNEPFRPFAETIEGFNYVEGFQYVIEVKIYDIKDPPADASSLRYVLSRIISKK